MARFHRFCLLARGLLGRAVLLCFALSLGAAVASPLVHPQAMELVCSASGAVKLVVKTDDGAQEMGATHLDCPMCLLAGAPPPAPAALALPHPQPLGHALQPIEAARLAAATAAPLPARGPPA
ncbi:DUF2946 family protein [Xenophilus sp.]|jgi:hypothetical protein|uniref:DUF2946 family protein n=1 Tax=Xenophilus sp. TaxID=1873499 RepID=UPI0037DD3A92